MNIFYVWIMPLATVIILGRPAEARVFDFSSNWVAPYFRGTAGMISTSKDAFADTSGTATKFSDGAEYDFGGELGFAFLFSERVALRIGFEGLQSKKVAAAGKHGAVKVMDIESSIASYSPAATLELIMSSTNTSRFFTFLGWYYSSVRLTNDYTLNAAGTAAYSGVTTPYQEAWEGTAQSIQAGFGYEKFLLDNVTVSFEAGYRMLAVPRLEYKDSVKGIRGAAGVNLVAGAMVTDNAGEKMSLDMSGGYVGLTLKFYIPPLN